MISNLPPNNNEARYVFLKHYNNSKQMIERRQIEQSYIKMDFGEYNIFHPIKIIKCPLIRDT